MSQGDLLELFVGPRFNGPEYSPPVDHVRLTDQHVRIRALMLDGWWRTLAEISEAIGAPAASVSAQLRHLRKERFGSYIVGRRKRGDRKKGLFEYRVAPPGSDPAAAVPRQKSWQVIAELRARVAELEAELAAVKR